MDRSTIGFLVIVAVFVALVVLAIRPWRRIPPLTGLPVWRKLAFGLGSLALTVQVVIFAYVWTRVREDQVLFPRWSQLIFPLFWISVIGIFAGKGMPRWVLLTISILVMAVSFFAVLSV